MLPGYDLDALIEDKIFNGFRTEDQFITQHQDGLPRYSHDPQAAILVMEALRHKYYIVQLAMDKSLFTCTIHAHDGQKSSGSSKRMPMAISLAAVKALQASEPSLYN